MGRDSPNEAHAAQASALNQALSTIEARLNALEPGADVVADALADAVRALGAAAREEDV
jgi:hypothetical protein